MARDPNGVYNLPPSYFVQTGDTILPVQHNPVFESVANALTNSIARDGRTVMTGNLQMGGNKVTNIAPGTNDGDAVNALQLRDRVDAVADFATVADMRADNNQRIGYAGSGARVIVTPGQIITAQGFRYEVAASDAVAFDKDAEPDGYHIINAGSVKFKALPFRHGLYLDQLGEIVSDGVADDYAAIQKWIDIAFVLGVEARAGQMDCAIATPLSANPGQTIDGTGRNCIIRQINSANPQVFTADGVHGVRISGFKLVANSGGTKRWAMKLWHCDGWRIGDIWFEDAPGTNGVGLYECTNCHARDLYFDGQGNGYCWSADACINCSVIDSAAKSPRFGFLIIGQDVSEDGTTLDGSGNRIHNCYVSGAYGHSFDINASHNNIISSCVAEDYVGEVLTAPAFQIKHPSGDNCRGNVVIGCTARNVAVGFGGQQGAGNSFIGCTVEDCEIGFFYNSLQNNVIQGFRVRGARQYSIRCESSSNRNVFDGGVIESIESGSIGISIGSSGGTSCSFDNIVMFGTMAKSIEIAANVNNTRFGHNVLTAGNPIDDQSNSTIWPLLATTPVISLSSTGTVWGPYLNRGMVVAKARFAITTTITGSPEVRIGRTGATSEAAAQQAIAGSAGETVILTPNSGFLDTAAQVQGVVGAAGTGGAGFFQLEGLPRL